jgi:type I restriction enzyme, S subunit
VKIFDRLAHLADGAAYPAVRPEVVLATEIFCAGESLVEALSMATGPLIDRLEANKQESITLAATRDLLLPRLMSGEIRLQDADRTLGDVL